MEKSTAAEYILVIAKLSDTAFEGRLRDGTGKNSRVVVDAVLKGVNREEVIGKAYFYGLPFKVVDREDPFLTGC